MNVGLIGAGHIARALAEGWSRPAVVEPPSLVFFDVDADKARELAAATGGAAVATAAELLAGADLVIVAVRPQYVEGVLQEMAAALDQRLVVSVAAGVSQARLEASLPPGARVARVMPNVAAALGQGLFLLVPGTLGPGVAAVGALFALAGDVVEVDEALFDAATSVAGCMPGVIAYLVEAFAAAGVARGLSEDVARAARRLRRARGRGDRRPRGRARGGARRRRYAGRHDRGHGRDAGRARRGSGSRRCGSRCDRSRRDARVTAAH